MAPKQNDRFSAFTESLRESCDELTKKNGEFRASLPSLSRETARLQKAYEDRRDAEGIEYSPFDDEDCADWPELEAFRAAQRNEIATRVEIEALLLSRRNLRVAIATREDQEACVA